MRPSKREAVLSARQGGILNVVVGIVGPLIGGGLLGPLPDFDAESAGQGRPTPPRILNYSYRDPQTCTRTCG